jgi:hypothetical protein
VAAVTRGRTARDAALEDVMEELRALGLLALDRLDPLVGRLSEAVSAPPEPDGATTHRCTACPVCVALTERADALAEVAQHATGLLAALRVALAERDRAEPGPAAPRSERVVQHIPVERTPTC